MRKYLITDASGYSAGQKLESGKFVQTAAQHDEMLKRVGDCCADTPLVAALISPIAAEGSRLFMINCWSVAADQKNGQSYTVVKEIAPVPQVRLHDKIAFALRVITAVYRDADFSKWAQGWLSGADRSAKSAQAAVRVVEAEKNAAHDVEALAAWGGAGFDGGDFRKGDEANAERAMHIARAAGLAGSPSTDEAAVLQELARGLAHLDELAKQVNLAEQAAKTVPASEGVPVEFREVG